MNSKFNIRVIAKTIGMVAMLFTMTHCGNNASNESAANPIKFPSEAIAGQSGMLELTVPAVAVSVSSSPPNAVVCDNTLIQNSAGEGINCAFGAIGSGSVTVTVAVTSAGGQVTTYTSQGQISLPPTPVTQDTFSVAITNPQNNTMATVTNNSTSQNMPTTVMNLATAVSLQGSVVASGSLENVNWGDGITQGIASGTVDLSHTYAKPGAYTMTVSAAGNGAAGSLSVALQVLCDATIPPMVAANSPLTAALVGGSDNQYHFTANITGGSGNFTSLWSPDGTGVYRDPAVSGLTAKYFVDYSGVRNMQAIVTDVACGNQLTLNQSYNFAIPTSNGTPGQAQGPQIGSLPFVQGNIASTTASTAQDERVNGFLSLIQAASDPSPKRLQGNYQVTTGSGPFPSSFNESGFTTINDNKDGIVLNATFDSNGVMTIQNVTVSVSGNTELGSLLADSYTTTSCSAAGTVTPVMGADPCSSGSTGTITLGYLIDYTYSCPLLADSAGNTISLTKGAGYYVVDTSQGSCGGSGQSGGSAPPAF